MIQATLSRILLSAATAAAPDLGLDPTAVPEPEIIRPKQKEHGDWASNVALVLAPRAHRAPREVAQAIVARVQASELIDRAEVAGPGFINLFLRTDWLREALRSILEAGPAYGRAGPNGRRVQVEFVSANPTGPLHVGTARNAALGDSVANVLEAAGYDVEREYYFNDAGSQLELFGASVEARYLERFGVAAEIPDGGYQGEYIADLAAEVGAKHGDALLALETADRRRIVLAEAVDLSMAGIRRTLQRFGVRMDTWASQSELGRSGAIADAVGRLRESGHAYEQDGAIFFRATEFGDEKDRVLIRSNGEPTYFAADCAYVVDKAARGFDRMIYVWGADHHGTVKRLMGAGEALGVDPGKIEVLLYQLVSLYRAGEEVRMSRRAGDYVTLDELIDEVGADAARYTLLSRSSDTPLDFDLEVVTRQTLDNPVYYVQYAHARIASVLRMAERRGVERRPWQDLSFEELTEEAELDLLRELSEFGQVIESASEVLAPHRLTRYAEQVAASFHRFYRDCRVISEDDALTQSRLWLAAAAQQVIHSALGLIGVSAPEAMERLGDNDGDGDAEPDPP